MLFSKTATFHQADNICSIPVSLLVTHTSQHNIWKCPSPHSSREANTTQVGSKLAILCVGLEYNEEEFKIRQENHFVKRHNVTHPTMATPLQVHGFLHLKAEIKSCLERLAEEAFPDAILVLSSNGFLSDGVPGGGKFSLSNENKTALERSKGMDHYKKEPQALLSLKGNRSLGKVIFQSSSELAHCF